MRIVVCVNAVLDAGMPIRPADDGRTLLQGLAAGPEVYRISSGARSALEMALELSPDEVIAVSVGGEESNGMLAWCKARGAVDARHVDSGRAVWAPENIVRNLIPVVSELAPKLVLCGAYGDRVGSGAVPQMLADMLGWPYVDMVLTTEFTDDIARVMRRLPKGWRGEVECALPAVLGCDPAATTPRYVSSRAQRKARALGIERAPTAAVRNEPEILSFAPARPRQKKSQVPSAPQKAEDRIRFMLGGGLQKKQTNVAEDAVDRQVSSLIEFLREQAILD